MHGKVFFTGIITSLVLGFSLNAFADMNMKISNLCNIDSKYWEVEINNPPGYIRNIAGDGSFTVPSNVQSGTLLSAGINSAMYCLDKYPGSGWQACQISVAKSVLGPWTAPSDGGTLPVKQYGSSKYINCNG